MSYYAWLLAQMPAFQDVEVPAGIDVTSSGLYTVQESRSGLVQNPSALVLRAGYDVFEPMSWWVPVLRDANATAGTWPEVIRLEHVPVVWADDDVHDAEVWSILEDIDRVTGIQTPESVRVPLFVGDPERALWRRRKWWGRGPIKPLRAPPDCDAVRWCARLAWCEYPNCCPF